MKWFSKDPCDCHLVGNTLPPALVVGVQVEDWFLGVFFEELELLLSLLESVFPQFIFELGNFQLFVAAAAVLAITSWLLSISTARITIKGLGASVSS